MHKKWYYRGLGSSRRTILVIFVISYVILLIIPMIVGVTAYYQLQKDVKADILRTSDVKRVMAAEQFDTQLAAVENLMSRISAGQKFNSIFQNMQKELPVSTYDSRLLLKELQNARLNLDIVQEMYLYFSDLDLVVSGSSVMNKAVAYDVFHSSNALSKEEWETLMKQNHIRDLRTIPMASKNFSEGNQIVYLQSLPLSNATGNDVTLAIFLNKNRFMDMFKKMPDVDGDIVVINAVGEILMSSDGSIDIVDAELPRRAIGSEEPIYYRPGDTSYVVDATQSSQISGIYYISLIPEGVLFSRFVRIRNMGIIALTLILVCGLVLVFYFSRKNVMPIYNMVKFIRKTMGSEGGEDRDDVRYITTAMESVQHKIFTTEKDLRAQKRVLKDYFLKDLLTEGSPADEGVFMRAMSHDVYCEAGDYMVILLDVYEYQDFFRDSEVLEQLEQERTVHFILSNVMTELFDEEYHTQMVMLDHFTSACIIHIPEATLPAEERVKDVLEQTHDFIGSNFQIYFTAAVSGRHSFRYLSEAYTEAVAIAYQGKPNDEMVALQMDFYQRFPNGELNVVDEPFARKLANHLRGRNIQEAQLSLKEFFADRGVYTAEYGDMLKYDLILTILKALPEQERDAFIEATTPFAKLTKSKSFPVIEQTFCQLLEDAVPFLPDPGRKISKFSDEIMQYVREEYRNVNLSITMIAEHFEMNAHYMSLRFREETGESLKTFISLVRIEEAKQILLSTSNKLDKIAEMVGFIDDRAFIRVFKKFEGITPGKYREIARTGAALPKNEKSPEFTE